MVMSTGLEHMMSSQERVVKILLPLLKGVCSITVGFLQHGPYQVSFLGTLCSTILPRPLIA